MIRPVTVESIQLAKYFFMEAARLHPENPQIASRLLEMAILAEDRELVEQATKILLSCDPSNQAAQLRRLLQAVDRYQHADERIRAYELMLDDSNIEVIGKVMSRIALSSPCFTVAWGTSTSSANGWVARSIWIPSIPKRWRWGRDSSSRESRIRSSASNSSSPCCW